MFTVLPTLLSESPVPTLHTGSSSKCLTFSPPAKKQVHFLVLQSGGLFLTASGLERKVNSELQGGAPEPPS